VPTGTGGHLSESVVLGVSDVYVSGRVDGDPRRLQIRADTGRWTAVHRDPEDWFEWSPTRLAR
jgi:hypothetical protein